MFPVLALLVGAVLGFVGSRRLRRPERSAQVASVARQVGASVGGRRRSLTAPELQRACLSEMIRHVRRAPDGRVAAPSRYVIHLHPDDLATVEETRRWFTDGLTEGIVGAAAGNQWRLDRPVAIDYREDLDRRRGLPLAVVDLPPAPKTPGALTRADTGARIALGSGAVTIGRSRDRTVVVDDDRVSRSHAHLEPHDDGWAIVDDGSANGTRVNGTEIASGRPHPIHPDDVIAAGPLELRVEPATPTSAPAGASLVLDAEERTRIVGNALPPGSDGR